MRFSHGVLCTVAAGVLARVSVYVSFVFHLYRPSCIQVPPDARATGPENSPPRSPTAVLQGQRGALERAEGADPALRPALSAPEPLVEADDAAADAQGTAQAAGVAPRAAGRGVAEGRHAGGAAGGAGGPQPLTNSVQMLLNRAHSA